MTALNFHDVLACQTPDAWCDYAAGALPVVLIDHAHCEKKAASSALAMIYRYVDKAALLHKMSRLAREELRHFEQVLKLLKERDVPYQQLAAGGYAKALHAAISDEEPQRLVDSLLIGAIIEARSCERFDRLAVWLDSDPALQGFYRQLYKAEHRHCEEYLQLAEMYAPPEFDLAARLKAFAAIEKAFILAPDACFRFHSGVPTAALSSIPKAFCF